MVDHEIRAADFSLADLVGQSMILPLYGSSATEVTAEQAAANRSIYGMASPADVIKFLRPGGVVLLDRIPFHPEFGDLHLDNVVSSHQLVNYLGELQTVARDAGMPSLLIVADQEGGRVNRLPVPPLPAPAVIGSTKKPDLARRAGELTARIAKSLGVNLLFHPVADVGASNQAIGDRAFGSDPALVADMVSATVVGIAAVGVGSTAKHWPGHGRADADSHNSLPTLNVDLSDWRSVELPPFRAAIEAGVDAIVVAHVNFPAADPTGQAASESPRLLERLRHEAGFSGVAISDALWMPSIRRATVTDAAIAERVLAAGVDLLLSPPDPAGTIRLISQSPQQEKVRSTLETGVERSLSLRRRVEAGASTDEHMTDWAAETQDLVSEADRGN